MAESRVNEVPRQVQNSSFIFFCKGSHIVMSRESSFKAPALESQRLNRSCVSPTSASEQHAVNYFISLKFSSFKLNWNKGYSVGRFLQTLKYIYIAIKWDIIIIQMLEVGMFFFHITL